MDWNIIFFYWEKLNFKEKKKEREKIVEKKNPL